MNKKIGSLIITSLLVASIINFPTVQAGECTKSNSNGHCYKTSTISKRDGKSKKENREETSEIPADSSSTSQSVNNEYFNFDNWFNNNYQTMTDETGAKIHARKTTNRRPGEPECYSGNKRPGKYTRTREKPITSDDTATYTLSCQPNDTKTLAPTNPQETPKGPTAEEMLQEIEDQFANTTIQPPILHQTFNLGL